jgi:hypothetical protein
LPENLPPSALSRWWRLRTLSSYVTRPAAPAIWGVRCTEMMRYEDVHLLLHCWNN